MKMRNYMKNEQYGISSTPYAGRKSLPVSILSLLSCKKIVGLGCLGILAILTLVGINHRTSQVVSIEDLDTIQFASAASAVSGKKSIITIPSGIVKENPFVPYRNIDNSVPILDVPAVNLVEPPEMVDENSDAARVMDTIVSGILYDKYSPSAILNIEGNDYLVKKGDVVNNYKVVNIMKDSVTVKLGTNVYKAGIGEILTEGSLNYNDVSNLNNKFGGVRK